MDIVEFFGDVEKNDMQYLLTNPHIKYTEKSQRMTSAYIQASKAMRRDLGRELTEEEKQQVMRDAERSYNRDMRQKRKAAIKLQIAAAL